MTDRLAEIRAAEIAQNETQPMWIRDLAADYCETLKKLALQEGYTRGWEERARKAESERDDLLARLAPDELVRRAAALSTTTAEEAVELAGRMSVRPLTPAEAERAVDTILACAAALEAAEKELDWQAHKHFEWHERADAAEVRVAELEAAEKERDAAYRHEASAIAALNVADKKRWAAEARVEELETALKWIRGLAQNKLAFHTAFRHIYRRAEEALAASPPPPADKDGG